ncbi:MAG TPA: formylglycine-generating enzyme family protein [Blastocatellia bacterium]|nr:formylglycine-generating enzyme family protein [Blastocatellia bacterium]
MNAKSERWTQEQRRQALNAFFESKDGLRFLQVFSFDCTAPEDREVFLRDAERRFQFNDEKARRWWDSLQAMLKTEPHRFLALAEPLAQNGIAIEELYDCLPDDFDPLALMRAINLARNAMGGKWGGLPPPGITNTAGWSVEQVRNRLEEVKARLDWRSATADARQWWEAFETSDEDKWSLELVLALAEELANRRVTINDFLEAYVRSNTGNIRAILNYLDYTRMKAEAAQSLVVEGAGQSTLTSADSGWWVKPALRVSRIRGWTEEQIRFRLEEVKGRLRWSNADGETRAWWETFENENQHRLALVLRLAEELANRNVTVREFHRACDLSGTSDIQANLFFLDYLHFTTKGYEFETVVLDESGEIIERHQLKAHRFIDELVSGVTIEMVEIPGGKFIMGSPKNEVGRWNSEGPQREVIVLPFYIGKYTITQKQWNVVAEWDKVERDLNPKPSRFEGDDRPVEQVSWEDAKEFCARLAIKTGRAYRLPTEAEWEYACRAGTTKPFAFGETITPEIVNYDGEYPYAKAKEGENRSETIHVGSLGVANAFGLFDMHGNVWEWCEDVWHDDYDGTPRDGSAWLSGGDSSYRVLRGGSWSDSGRHCRSADREHLEPDARGDYIGFRVVVGARVP